MVSLTFKIRIEAILNSDKSNKKKLQTFSLPSNRICQVFTSPGPLRLHKRDFASIFIQCLYQRVNPIACYLDLLQAGNITFSHAKIWGVPEPRKWNTEISVAPFNASVRERSGLLFFKTFLMWIHVGSGAKLIKMQTWPKWRWNESDKY